MPRRSGRGRKGRRSWKARGGGRYKSYKQAKNSERKRRLPPAARKARRRTNARRKKHTR